MRSRPLIFFLLLIMTVGILIFPIGNKFVLKTVQAPKNQGLTDSFDVDHVYESIQIQLDMGARIPGTTANRQCVQWIINEFPLSGSILAYNFTTHGTLCQNVIGKMNTGKEQIIAFAAHFDTRAIAEKDPNLVNRNNPIPGANDGASGVAVLLELARVISITQFASDYEFWFIFFDAEDQGDDALNGWTWCEGSKWLAADMIDQPTTYFSANQTIANLTHLILLDMVGGTNLEFIAERYSDAEFLQSIFKVGQELGYLSAFPTAPKSAGIIDDHVAFANQGIKTADLIIDFWSSQAKWPYHHTLSDNLDHISKESLSITGITLLTYIIRHYGQNAGTTPTSTNDNTNDNGTNEDVYVIVIVAIIGGGMFSIFIIRKIAMKNNNEKAQNTELKKKQISRQKIH